MPTNQPMNRCFWCQWSANICQRPKSRQQQKHLFTGFTKRRTQDWSRWARFANTICLASPSRRQNHPKTANAHQLAHQPNLWHSWATVFGGRAGGALAKWAKITTTQSDTDGYFSLINCQQALILCRRVVISQSRWWYRTIMWWAWCWQATRSDDDNIYQSYEA